MIEYIIIHYKYTNIPYVNIYYIFGQIVNMKIDYYIAY